MKIVKVIRKTVLAGIIAVAILSGIMCFYDLMPVHHDNPKKNTDYVWEANAPWVKLTEGVSFGRFDADGYNNPNVIEDPDILVLGSSHMEGTNVFFDQTVCGRLSKELDNRYSVYNLGISGLNLFTVCQYLPNNLKMHKKIPKIAIIETSTVSVTETNVNRMLNSELDHAASQAIGIIGILQKVPFIRNLYHQKEWGLLDLFMNKKNKAIQADDSEKTEQIADEKIDDAAYDKLFQYLSEQEKEYGTQIIIFYHPTEILDDELGVVFKSGAKLKAFAEYAQKYDIDFIDMTEPFMEMYQKEHLVPHGFVTGKVGTGHLNANGHRVIAEELVKTINTLEKEGALCK